MGDLTKQEIAAMKVKEAGNRTKALAASKIHDAEVIDSIKSKFGMGQPAPAPAPVDTMGNVTGMKKGGKVFRHHDGIAQRGKTRA